MDSGELNKIAGGVIGALLVFLLLGFFSELIYYGAGGHPEEEDPVLAFAVEVQETGAAEEEEIVDFPALLAAADPSEGERQFNKCRSCHSLEEGDNGVGPYLWDVVGRDIAAVEGFAYSEALLEIDGIWDMQNLFQFIHDPNGWAPGTKMSFAGLPDDQDKMNLIAFLNRQTDDPTPLVAPEPVTSQLDPEELEEGAEVATEAAVPVIEEPTVESSDSPVKGAQLPREEEAEAAAAAARDEIEDEGGDIDNTATFSEQVTVPEEVPGVEPPAGPAESLEGEPLEEEGIEPEAQPGSDAMAGPEAVVDEEVETETRVEADRSSGATVITEEDRVDPLPEATEPAAEPAPGDADGQPAAGETTEEGRQGSTGGEPAAPQDTADQAAQDGGATDDRFAPLLAAASAEAGERIFRRCQACHRLEEGQNAIGPHLHNLVGREIAGVEDYDYSDALAAKPGAWDLQNLDAFLADPGGWAPGTKMSFVGLDDPQDRVDVITYINEASGAPVDLGAVDTGTRQAAASSDAPGAPARDTAGAGARAARAADGLADAMARTGARLSGRGAVGPYAE